MNQILATHNNSNNNKKYIDTKKIVVFFCVAIIIFGLVVISVATYNLLTRDREVKEVDIQLEQIEDKIKIIAIYENELSSIKYIWNENDVYKKEIDGTTKYELLIDLPENVGENILEVEVIGQDGSSKKVKKSFIIEGEESEEPDKDEQGPKIQMLIKYSENMITVIATDEKELKYMKYQWDNKQATVLNPTNGTDDRIEANIDIERGQHTLSITAEDIDGNIATKTGDFKGVKKPKISAIRYDDIVEINISHDMGLKKIEFIVNNQVYVYDENYSGYNAQITDLLYKVNLKEGENVIQVTAESLEEEDANTKKGTVTIYKGKCTYTPTIDTNE